MRLLQYENFYVPFIESHYIAPYYKVLYFSLTDNFFSSNKSDPIYLQKVTCTSVRLFPKYLVPEFKNDTRIKIKKVRQDNVIGYAVNIKEEKNIEHFLRCKYAKKFRKSIYRSVNRFETCLKYSYRMIDHHIDFEEYSFLMDRLRCMLTFRFNERNEPNDVLHNWDYHYELTYNLIKKKRAFIFVIYHDNTPINISINHHFNAILFISISSFDYNFSKFSLGNIAIFKIIEWSIKNNYSFIDMGYGTLEYKRLWSNYTYGYENHIIYKKSIIPTIIATMETLKIQLKNQLKQYGIDSKITRLKSKLRKEKKSLNTYYPYILEPYQATVIATQNSLAIDITSNTRLVKPVMEYLFLQSVHISDISLYEITPKKEYLICGGKIAQKIIFK